MSLPLPASARPGLGGRSLSLSNVPDATQDQPASSSSPPHEQGEPTAQPLRSRMRAYYRRHFPSRTGDEADAAGLGAEPDDDGPQQDSPRAVVATSRPRAARVAPADRRHSRSLHFTTHGLWGRMANSASESRTAAEGTWSSGAVIGVDGEEDEDGGQAEIRIIEAAHDEPASVRRRRPRRDSKPRGAGASTSSLTGAVSRKRPTMPASSMSTMVVSRNHGSSNFGRRGSLPETPNERRQSNSVRRSRGWKKERERKEELAAFGDLLPATETPSSPVPASRREPSAALRRQPTPLRADSSGSACSVHSQGASADWEDEDSDGDLSDDDEGEKPSRSGRRIEELYEAVIVDRDQPWSEAFGHSPRGGVDDPIDPTSDPQSGGSRTQPTSGGDVQQSQARRARPHFALPSRLQRFQHTIVQPLFAWTDLSFDDPAREHAYQQDRWVAHKATVFAGSLFFLFTWALLVGLSPRPFPTAFVVSYYGLGPALILPLPVMVFCDVPAKFRRFWQVWIYLGSWTFAVCYMVVMHSCGYGTKNNTCHGRDFMGFFIVTICGPTIALMCLGQQRLVHVIGACMWFILANVLITASNPAFAKNSASFIVYAFFLTALSFFDERTERRLVRVRDQLKVTARAAQRSQMREKAEEGRRRRLTAYLFHEIRVPLNTALLAVQNMQASGVFVDRDDDQGVEFHALFASLQSVHGVLNDVLDFNRMDAGKLETVDFPFAFHRSLKSMLGVLNAHKDIKLQVDLDPRIDAIACAALRAASAGAEKPIAGTDPADGDGGIVMGDELRLRQCVQNVCSNAVKFSREGGKIRIATKLVWPPQRSPSPEALVPDDSPVEEKDKQVAELSQVNLQVCDPAEVDFVVVRVEVEDEGVGIAKEDVIHARLFSPYVQTEIGRSQGGKGTGLGLALLRQIVRLNHGRLGVQSRKGAGSMFWFELPLKVGKAVLAASSPSLLPRPVMRTGRSSEKAAGAWRPGTGEMSYIPMLVSPVPPPSTNGTLSTIGSPPPSLGSRKPSTASDGSSRAPSAHTSRGLPLPAVSESGNTPTATAASVFASSVLTASPRRQPAIALPPPAAARSTSDQSVGLDDGMPSDPPVSILVVDDDPLTRRLMSRMLERMGHRVSSAENGAVALEMLLASPKDGEPRADEAGWEGPFDVCVCDNWMPVLSGCEVVEELRRRGRADFFVGATGNALIKDQKDYKEAGADEVLTKPLLEKDLRRVARDAYRRRLARPPT